MYTYLYYTGTAVHVVGTNSDTQECTFPFSQIERIQNPGLWKSLQIQKRVMEQRNNHQNNERRLFHGTCEDTAAHINEHGFNRSFAGKNGEKFKNTGYLLLTSCVTHPIPLHW